MALFRQEAMAARARALEGEVALAAPLPWRLTGAVLLALVAGALLWLTLGRVTEVRQVALTARADGSLIGTITGDPLPPGVCGALAGLPPAEPVRVCLIGPPASPAVTRIAGRLVSTRRVRARTSRPVAPGTVVTARFAIGRSRPAALLW